MGLRQLTSDKQGLVVGVFGVILAGSIAYLLWQFVGGSTDPRLGSGKAFYSIDDGKSYFVEDSAKIAPFDHEGKQAVQAMVYTADGGKTRFVGYLMRFSERGKAKMNEMRTKIKENRGMPSLDPELQANTEVKKPGDKNWVKLSDIANSGKVMLVMVPNDPTRAADPVEP